MKEYNSPLLFSPGPTEISPQSLFALSRPPIHHRTDQFESVLKECFANLKLFFQTKDHVFILNATGTGAMEACIINVLNKGDKVLALDGGKFGERWASMSEIFGFDTDVLKSEWGKKFDFESFEQYLRKNKYSAFLVHACETSTATKYPIKEINELLKKIQPECLLLVDGITSVGCTDLPMDELGIDGLIAGSQKSLGLMTGLSFLSFSERAWKRVLKNSTPKFYFDMVKEKKMNMSYATHFSSPVNMINALAERLSYIKEIGIDSYIRRSLFLQGQTVSFLKELGCSIFSESPSESLTAFELPEPMKASELQDLLLKNGLYLAGGQDHLKGKVLRWGHMGAITDEAQIKAMKIFKDTFYELRN